MGDRITIPEVLLAACLLGFCLPARAQNPQLETRNGRRFPTVTFSWVRWGANPPYYSIAIDSSGDATYQSAPPSVERTGEPYTVEFPVSLATRKKVFAAVEQMKFLDLPSKNVQHFGGNKSIKTLSFREAGTHNFITYQTSRNPLVRQLTVLFQNISTTLEFGRRLTLFHQAGGKKLSSELKRMQKLARKDRLPELQAIAPELENIASDARVDQTDRKRAEQILHSENKYENANAMFDFTSARRLASGQRYQFSSS